MIATTASLLGAQLFWLFPLDGGRYTPSDGVRLLELKAMSINSEFGGADPDELALDVGGEGINVDGLHELVA